MSAYMLGFPSSRTTGYKCWLLTSTQFVLLCYCHKRGLRWFYDPTVRGTRSCSSMYMRSMFSTHRSLQRMLFSTKAIPWCSSLLTPVCPIPNHITYIHTHIHIYLKYVHKFTHTFTHIQTHIYKCLKYTSPLTRDAHPSRLTGRAWT